MKRLIPKSFNLFPNKETREFHIQRSLKFGFDKFETYNDWFYFIHIDPMLRWWHAIGMLIGIFFYALAFKNFLMNDLALNIAIEFLLGAFFFYFLPLISHHLYDGGKENAPPSRFHSTFIPVVHINFLTLTGRYDAWLRKFIQKYPFTVEAWELIEK